MRSTSGIAKWSIYHPVGVVMITLAIMVIGIYTFRGLPVDLLPHIVYPEVRVRIIDPGTPATIMEDKITRQLEEQLAITEDVVSIQSRTSEGRSSVDLSFRYGTDIETTLRDASTRLDRAKRFLPDTIDPPVIYKYDPSQLPVIEYVISSSIMDPIELRDWVDYRFSRWFTNLPGIAAAEVGGGLIREIHIIPDPQRLAALGVTLQELEDTIRNTNIEEAGGRIIGENAEYLSRVSNRFTSTEEIRHLPLKTDQGILYVKDVAQVQDTHELERLRVRLNHQPGIKLSIQKQPNANTVAVVNAVEERLQWLKSQNLVPADIDINVTNDQASYIDNALRNAKLAAISGTVLAMIVIYLFLGNIRRTLVIGSVIPIAVLVTLGLMGLFDLSLNIMTLGGLAVGIGLLVDSTIVMLENIYRHQQQNQAWDVAGLEGAAEVQNPIIASGSTNLAAIVPFLFIAGLTGLLFRELIFTITSAIIASMIVALTIVPALATRISADAKNYSIAQPLVNWLVAIYRNTMQLLLDKKPIQLLIVAMFITGLFGLAYSFFYNAPSEFLPKMDDGRVFVSITSDPGTSLDEMDRKVKHIESLISEQEGVEDIFTIAGGRIFGRSQYESPNRTSMTVILKPREQRSYSVDEWIGKMNRLITQEQFAGYKIRIYSRGVRGIRTSQGDEAISLRIQGEDLETLNDLAEQFASAIQKVPGLQNISHSAEEIQQEIAIRIDEERAAAFNVSGTEVSTAVNTALEGRVISEYLEGDRSYDIRLRYPLQSFSSPSDLEKIIVAERMDNTPIYLQEVGKIEIIPSPSEISRDNQQRMVEISAAISSDRTLTEIYADIENAIRDIPMPPGYYYYESGTLKTLQEGEQTVLALLVLAIFLVFVVLAVQYESVRNPFIILLGVPFAIIGVVLGLWSTGISISMPVWLGIIMLTGIVVNNAIILIEQIEIYREENSILAAIVKAGETRLRPILMTTITTIVGLLPLALAWGEGAEMLQPLAITIISGLFFSLLVSLLLIPVLYLWLHPEGARTT